MRFAQLVENDQWPLRIDRQKMHGHWTVVKIPRPFCRYRTAPWLCWTKEIVSLDETGSVRGTYLFELRKLTSSTSVAIDCTFLSNLYGRIWHGRSSSMPAHRRLRQTTTFARWLEDASDELIYLKRIEGDFTLRKTGVFNQSKNKFVRWHCRW